GFELNCKLKTYIYSISRRLWLKKLQLSQRTTYIYDNTEDVVAVEDEIDLHEKKNNEFLIMEESLAKVGEPCKTLLEEFYIHKKQMQEIAEMFGYTNADNAKTQKYKCLVRLKKLFFQQYKNI
ncbi:MAG: sigma-70 family RNA polymerase sigma factor, partial [Ferruginibacter sp.]